MIINVGPSGVASFTDESSPDSRETDNIKVSVNAQVLPQYRPDWFFELIYYFPDIPGELKSVPILNHFNNLPTKSKNKVWLGLSKVRIHITDPRPYISEVNFILREITGILEPFKLLRYLTLKRDDIARWFLEINLMFIAEKIYRDSPSQGIERYLLIPREILEKESETRIRNTSKFISFESDLKNLKFEKSLSIIRKITEWSSKSASVFSPALDNIEEPIRIEEMTRNPLHLIEHRVFKALSLSHAFDEGNKKVFDTIQEKRYKILDMVIRNSLFLGKESFVPLHTFISSDSFYGQAADIAARFAVSSYHQGGLLDIVRRFEYVTFNGVRVSENEAYDILRRSK